jgi:hypothetical protein
MNQLDKRLDDTFQHIGDAVDRRGLLKRLTILTGTVAGLTFGVGSARAAPSQCGSDFGRCDGCLCCSSYNGCLGSTGFYCGNTPSGCSKHSLGWSACCNSYWNYTWWDCCFSSNAGGCCTPSQCGHSCTGGSGCRVYCNGGNCYCCTFRTINANAC